VALLLGMLLSRYNFELLSCLAVADAGPGGPEGGQLSQQQRTNGSCACDDVAGSLKGAKEALGLRSRAGGSTAPGDPSGLLPPLDLRRLVGLKVPAGPCWVRFTRRSAL
jgi:hypothetical protein